MPQRMVARLNWISKYPWSGIGRLHRTLALPEQFTVLAPCWYAVSGQSSASIWLVNSQFTWVMLAPSPWLIDRVCSWAPAGYHDPEVSCRALTTGILGREKLFDRTLGRLTSEKATAKITRILMRAIANSHILHSDRLLRNQRHWLV